MAIYSKTNTFTANTLIQSAQVNTNFDEISTAINTTLFSGTSDTLLVSKGGTGAAALTANNVILGNGTSAVQFVAPSTAGKVLQSDGSTWASTDAAASQAQQEAGSSTITFVTPGRQHYHQSAAKAWCKADYSAGSVVAYNVASITDAGTGRTVFNWTTSFSTANYTAVGTVQQNTSLTTATSVFAQQRTDTTASACHMDTIDVTGTSFQDASYMHVIAFGDQ